MQPVTKRNLCTLFLLSWLLCLLSGISSLPWVVFLLLGCFSFTTTIVVGLFAFVWNDCFFYFPLFRKPFFGSFVLNLFLKLKVMVTAWLDIEIAEWEFVTFSARPVMYYFIFTVWFYYYGVKTVKKFVMKNFVTKIYDFWSKMG